MRLSVLLLLLTACAPETKDTGEAADTGDIDETGETGDIVTEADGDGYGSDVDCDDTNAAINPGASEECNAVDDNCDGTIDEGVLSTWYVDVDGDGFGDAAAATTEACEVPTGYVANGQDCDDTRADINPGANEDDCADPTDYNCDGSVGYADADGDGVAACLECDDAQATVFPGNPEICDDLDNDCNSVVDDGALDAVAWYLDQDADQHGDAAASISACDQPAGYAAVGDDCDDADAAFHPGAPEEDCADPNDYNCDGSVAYADADGDGFAACEDCDDASADVRPDAIELCNDVDDDCDLTVDEDDAADALTWYEDLDGDGYGVEDAITLACDMPAGYAATGDDCDDDNTVFNPGAAEDDCTDPNDYNCDGSVAYADADADGFAACAECDDVDALVFPGATETCNLTDDDCDGTTDEADAADASTWYADADGDLFGDPLVTTIACAAPTAYVADATDCDDTTAERHPGNTEICDDLDNDCDTDVDDGAADALIWYADADGDTFGDADVTQAACDQPTGYVGDLTDCDDTSALALPGGTEACDDLDNDCDGAVDDGVGTSWYADVDGDTYGDAASTQIACDQPAGWVADATDCEDALAAINPGAAEVCENGYDDDCSAVPDCEPSGSASPATDAWLALYGSTANDNVGTSFAFGDWNGDGHTDLSVGHNYDPSTSKSNTGRLHLFWGPLDGTETIATDDVLVDASTLASGDGFGTAVTGVSDMDGDGDDELFVASSAVNVVVGSTTYTDMGQAWLFRSPTADTTNTAADTTFRGVTTRDYLGAGVVDAGDQDSDGYADIATGAYGYDPTVSGSAVTDAGAVALWHGADVGTSETLTDASVLIVGTTASGYLGSAVAAGDLDGDGTTDLVVGAGGADSSSLYGAAYVFHGPLSTDGTVYDTDADVTLTGAVVNSRFGYQVSVLGDTTGDGTPDLAVGADKDDTAGTQAGAVYVWTGTLASGAASGADAVLTGSVAYDYAGRVVAAPGDVNGDGLADLMFSATAYDTTASGTTASGTGGAFLFYGPVSAGTATMTAADASWLGATSSEAMGYALAGADLDEDGYSDVLVGAPAHDQSSSVTNIGGAWLILGSGE